MGQPNKKRQAQRDRAKNIASSTKGADLTRANKHHLKSLVGQRLAVGGAHVINEQVESDAENCVTD